MPGPPRSAPRGIDPGPGNGQAEAAEAHLRHQGNVLFVSVIEIDGLMGRIQSPLLKFRRHPLRDGVASVGAHIRNRGSLSVQIPGAFHLVCGGGPAPKKILSESHAVSPFKQSGFLYLQDNIPAQILHIEKLYPGQSPISGRENAPAAGVPALPFFRFRAQGSCRIKRP